MDVVVTKTTFQKYPVYKDSGVEWLGEIPENWSIYRGKWLFKKEERPTRREDEIVTCFRDGQVTLRSNRRLEGFTNALKEHGYQGIRKGDLVIHAMDAFAGAIGVSDSDGKSTPVYSVCTTRNNNINQYYYAYFLRNMAVNNVILSLAKGIRERSTDFRFSDFGDLSLPFPPLPEQTAIASFLDDKTAKIDRAIVQKEKMIALLKERKQIIIQNAVTKGLNPDVKMKDSGVEWIGEIPEGWEVKRLKYLGKIYSGINGKSGEDFSKEYNVNMKPFVPFTNICNNLKIDESNYQYVKISDGEKQNRLKKNDILFLMSSETIEEIAKNSIYLGNNEELYLNSFCKGFRIESDKAHPEFLNYLLYSKIYRNYFSLVGRGFTRINLKQEYINDVFILLPPIQEQMDIVTQIEIQSAKIDNVIGLQEQQIEKLKELKSVLIDAAVTGKIKVN